jgi:hypothetical protein
VNIPKFNLSGDNTRSAPLSNGDTNNINDERFIDQLREVQNLKRYLFEEKVKFKRGQLGSIDLGPLNNLRFWSQGRTPTPGEWKLLDQKMSILTSYLNDELRQKIRIRELRIFFGLIPLAFLLASIGALLCRFLNGGIFTEDTLAFNTSYLLSLIVWTVAQGGLGACAFLGTRVATKRLEKKPLDRSMDTTDITDKSILKIRIILGCLFGSLIGIPIANLALDKIEAVLYPPANSSPNLIPSDLAFMILPFMIGFSTNLVLSILERSIDAIRTLFGGK